MQHTHAPAVATLRRWVFYACVVLVTAWITVTIAAPLTGSAAQVIAR